MRALGDHGLRAALLEHGFDLLAPLCLIGVDGHADGRDQAPHRDSSIWLPNSMEQTSLAIATQARSVSAMERWRKVTT